MSLLGKALDFQFEVYPKKEIEDIEQKVDTSFFIGEIILASDSDSDAKSSKSIEFIEAVQRIYNYEENSFKTVSEFKQETNSEKTASTVYTCKVCTYSTNNNNTLSRHINLKHNCKLCDRYWPDKNHVLHEKIKYILNKHVLEQNPYTCKECGLKFVEEPRLYQHLKFHGNVGVECKVCYFYCDSESELAVHTENIHDNENTRSSDFNKRELLESNVECSQCEDFWPDGDHKMHETMKEIMKRKVSKEHPYICKNIPCKQEIDDINRIYYHLKHYCNNHHCNRCPFMASEDDLLQRHMAKHQSGEPGKSMKMASHVYSCAICVGEFTRKSYLLRHMRSLHKNSKKDFTYYTYSADVPKEQAKEHWKINTMTPCLYECEICAYEFTKKQGYSRHMRAAHNIDHASKNCIYCARNYEKSDTPCHHVRLYKKKKKNAPCFYLCEICAKEFTSKLSFIRHMTMTHKNNDYAPEKKFTCYTCNYETCLRLNLIKHLLRHRERKQYMYCAECDYKTANKTNLIQHMVKHKDPAKLVWHKCTLCDFETRRPHTLRHHIKTHNVCY